LLKAAVWNLRVWEDLKAKRAAGAIIVAVMVPRFERERLYKESIQQLANAVISDSEEHCGKKDGY